LICLRLAKAGYAQGDPEKVMQMSADVVMQIVHYENFVAEYEKQTIELNRK
jgi:hypothetical protein